MLIREEFRPLDGVATDDFVKAHVMLCDARGVAPKTNLDAIAQDYDRYTMHTQGNLIRDIGFRLYRTSEGEPVGLSHQTVFLASSKLELNALAVAQQSRGNHFGSEILDDTIQTARDLGLATVSLSVHIKKKTARRLYESRGFQAIECFGSYTQMHLSVD